MTGPYALPVLAGSLLAAVAAGIHLGESAVALIDPVHFQGPALHPRERGAAIDENRASRQPPAYAGLYGWDEGHAALAAECGECRAPRPRFVRAYSAEVPYFGGGASARRAPEEPRTAFAFVEPAGEGSRRDAHVARYAHFPVSADEEGAYPDYRSRDVYLSDGKRNQGEKDFPE